MKTASSIVLVLLTLLLPLSAGRIFAQTCPTPPTGPHEGGGVYWYNYTPDVSCWSSSGSVSSTTLSCYGTSGFSYGMGWVNKITYTFTIGPNYPVLETWSADAFIEFNDPNDSIYNKIEIWAIVLHTNGTSTWYQLFSHSGPMGDIDCTRQGGNFSATQGDTVTIEITSTKWYSNTIIKSSGARIFTVGA